VARGNVGHWSTGMEKLPKTKDEIAQLIIAELRSFDCMNVLGVVIVPIVDRAHVTTWTVSCFNAGKSDGRTCDRALQSIVPRFQRAYDLVQKH
jgi:hypothetical protein